MFWDKNYSKGISINISILSILAIAYILYIWSSLILPFVIALLLSFWIISVAGFFKSKWMNKFFSFLFSAISFFIFFFIIWWIINTNINEISTPENILKYQNRLEILVWPILEYLSKFNISEDSLKDSFLNNIDFSTIFGNITWAIATIVWSASLIIIYVLFISLEYRFFKTKLELMSDSPFKRARLSSIISKIQNDVKTYFLIKTITSFATWALTYFTLLWFWVDFALFWAFSIFILNFIPTIGSIIWVWIITIFSIIQFGFTLLLVALILILIGIQILIWNIIEPKLMWSKLNLSPLVILLSLWLWGSIWGVIWMLLSVPIMVIINIILSKFDSTKSISILLSEKWIIETTDEISIQKTRKKLYIFLKKKFVDIKQ